MDHTRSSRPGRPALVSTLVCLAVLLAGCGGGGTSSAAGGSSSATSNAASSSAPSAGTSTPSTPSPTAKSAAPVPVEKNPPGDIPDNLAFVPYANKAGGYSFTHPEGWARSGSGTRVRFTEKLNGVVVESVPASQGPTVASARSSEVPRLRAGVPAFELRTISAVNLPAGPTVRIVFRRNSDPDPVTGKVYRDEVEEYLVQHAGKLVRMDLFGPVGADNVDAYRTMSQSLRLR
jgi:hypothetical protein